MLCYSPIRIVNQQRFLVTSNGDKLFQYVRCGKCASCQQIKAAEWIFRSYMHFKDCVENRNGFVLFDSLTYSDKFVPRIKQRPGFETLPMNLNYMCFSYDDIRKFMVRLRRCLSRNGYGAGVFDYFLSCEYGTDERFTHRPHYHVLFYVYSDIDPLLFSKYVSQCWKFGRTDGIPYKSKLYVQNNVFRSLSVGGRRVCNYVSKYVQKSSSFEKVINKRVDSIIKMKFPYDKRNSDDARKMRRDLRRVVCQFHRQSQGYGILAIKDIDVNELFERGFFKLENGKPSMYSRIPISQYYVRKLCYEKITLDDGYTLWSPREDRRYLLELRQNAINDSIKKDLHIRFKNIGDVPDYLDKLSEYMYIRGNNKGSVFNKVLTIGERLDKCDLFGYNSPSDKAHFGFRFYSPCYLGSKEGYHSIDNISLVNSNDYIAENAFCDGFFDKVLSDLEAAEQQRLMRLQQAFDNKQRLLELKPYSRFVY